MKQSQPTQEPGLPEDLALQFRQLAETETAGTTPFPGVNTAIRRRRATRYGGVALAGAVAAAVIVVEVVAGGAFDRTDQGTPATPSPSITATADAQETKAPTTPEEAGYPTSTVGSLAGDQTWLADLRQVVAHENAAGRKRVLVGDARIVAAGDIDDRVRYAITLYAWRPAGKPKQAVHWTREFWIGKPGVAASAMHSQTGDDANGGKVPDDAMFTFTTEGPSSSLKDAVAIVSAPRGRTATLTSGRTFPANGGTPTSTTRELTAVAPGVWAGPITEDEYFLSEAFVDGQGSSSSTFAPGFDLQAVAPSGTKPDDLGWLTGSIDQSLRPTHAVVPVYAGAVTTDKNTKNGKPGQAIIGLFRTPSGSYLYGMVFHQPDIIGDYEAVWQGSGLVPATILGGEPMITLPLSAGSSGSTSRYLVLAPEGTSRVRMGQATATVRDRLAVVEVPNDAYPGQVYPTAEALDSTGKVTATVSLQKPAKEDSTGFSGDWTKDTDATTIRP
jgi:hypothetical protein